MVARFYFSFLEGNKDKPRDATYSLKSIYKDFETQINARIKNNENLDITIIGIKSAQIVSASLKTSIAYISVKFNSEQVQVLKDLKGKIIEGDNNQILTIIEKWTFSKNLKSKDPNWKLVETGTTEID